MREARVENHLVALVNGVGGEIRKVKWLGRRGAPDRYVMLPGRWAMPPKSVWVELKAPGKTVDRHQQAEHERLRAFGQEVYVLDTIEAVDAFMKGYV